MHVAFGTCAARSEFLAATIECQGQLREEALAEAFDRLDSDNTGFISRANLKSILVGGVWSAVGGGGG